MPSFHWSTGKPKLARCLASGLSPTWAAMLPALSNTVTRPCNSGVRRIGQRPHLLSIQLELQHFMIGGAGAIDIFRSSLVADLQSMNAARTQGAQEFAFRRIDQDAPFSVRGDVDLAGLIDDQT